MDAQTPGQQNEPPKPSALHRSLATWPRRVGALIGSALVAWAVAQFAPGLWEETTERAGIAPASVQVELVMDPDVIQRFDPIHNPEFVVQRPIAQVGPPPFGEEERGRYLWAKEMDGVDALATVLRLVIRGRSEAPVTLHGLEVEIVERRPPLGGTLLTYEGQGAGQAVRYFKIELDVEPPTVSWFGPRGVERVLFPYRVSAGEQEVFDLYAFTLQHDVRWRLRLSYTDDEGAGAIVIDDHGQPFRTTALREGSSEQRAFFWRNGGWMEP